AGLSLDTLVRNVLSGGTQQLANAVAAVSSLAASDTLDAVEVRKAVRTLAAANVRPHRKTPGLYVGIIHPNTKYDLAGDTTTGSWVDVRKYTESGNKNIELNKIGDLYQVRFFETSNLQTVSSTVQTYNNIILGDNAYACAELNRDSSRGAKNPKILVKGLGSAGADDPLDQRASIGWKANFVPFLLDADRVMVIKTGASS
ncbi:MAG: N4-gp56 family major capsid protein, partial [Planctomycetota bacterium]|nr:N4-gp56 family major capsid protein [Planctomycetota bacterium]